MCYSWAGKWCVDLLERTKVEAGSYRCPSWVAGAFRKETKAAADKQN